MPFIRFFCVFLLFLILPIVGSHLSLMVFWMLAYHIVKILSSDGRWSVSYILMVVYVCIACVHPSYTKKYQITTCGISHWAWIAGLNAKMKWRKTKTHFCHYTSFTNHHCHWKQGSSGEFTVNISFNNSCIRKKRSDIPFLITNHPKLSSHFVTQKWPVNKLKCEIHLRIVQKCS